MQLITAPTKPRKRRLPVIAKRPSSIKVWEGDSEFNGELTQLIITGLEEPSRNRKTGPMLQAWILQSEISPNEASRTGKDQGMCGDCYRRRSNKAQLKQNGDKCCYVRPGEAAGSIWRSMVSQDAVGLSRAAKLVHASNRAIRWGAHGDPAMLPIHIGRMLTAAAHGHTGYTHQWRRDFAQAWKPLLMASADSVQDKREANAKGWSTFRVGKLQGEMMDDEILCPAYDTDNAVKCDDCRLCHGSSTTTNIVIAEH